MDITHHHSIHETIQQLATTTEGLSTAEAEKRRRDIGPNLLPEKKKASLIIKFFAQFRSALVLILVIAAAISFFFDRPVDSYVILGIILMNGVIGFIQEYRAEHAIESLKRLAVNYAKVFRDNQLTKIPAEQLVPGDLIVLEEGDRIPADARLIEAHNFRTIESSLTGESTPTTKQTDTLGESVSLGDQTNMVWLGTSAVGGTARAIVTQTGSHTVIGQLAKEVFEVKEQKTHFRTRTDELAKTMGLLAVFGTLLVFIIGFLARRTDILELFLFSIATLVSAIPEGLPAALTVVLAIGAHRIAKRRAIVRHLPATETLAVTTVIATDKTGTLTQNSMTARRIVLGDGTEVQVGGSGWEASGEFILNSQPIEPSSIPALATLLQFAGIGVSAKVMHTNSDFEIFGDPTEAALVVLAEKGGFHARKLEETLPVLSDLPFEGTRRYRGKFIAKDGEQYLVIIGAFETVLELSKHVLDHQGVSQTLTPSSREHLEKQGNNMADAALRTIGIAFQKIPKGIQSVSFDDVQSLTFVGFVGLIDPPRPNVPEAIRLAKQAGIRVIMKTGDHKKTAVAIAREIGLIDANDSAVFTEENLAGMTEEQFHHAVRTASVFARVSPQTKLRIVETLQSQGEVVAVTGDGVNDAPALRKADIGIAMGKIGTDVARESSELILTDDNFSTIIDAIEEGRVVFRNVRQTSFYLVTTNGAEVATIIITLLLGIPLPLLPIHVLWLNVVTDGLPNLSLAFEPKHNGILLQKPRKKNERILSISVFPFLGMSIVIMAAGTLFLFFSAFHEDNLMRARTLAFSFMAWTQILNAWNLRSLSHSLFQLPFFGNPFLVIATASSILIQFFLVHTPFFQHIFQFTPLSLSDWVKIIGLSTLVLWTGELYKFLAARQKTH